MRELNSRLEVVKLVDTEELRKLIKERGLKYGYIASEMGLSTYGLQRKVDGITDFKAKEIVELTSLLRLTKAQRDSIFLSG